jgi:hypothetical protein
MNEVQRDSLKRKYVWNLTMDEVDWICRNLHMNRYVEMALRTIHTSCLPLNKSLHLRPKAVPDCLLDPVQKLIRLSPYIGNADPATTHCNATYYSFELFRALGSVSAQDLERTILLLTTLAYIPLLAERNNGLLIWKYPVVRDKTSIEPLFAMIQGELNIDTFVRLANQTWGLKVTKDTDPTEQLFHFIIAAVPSIIIEIENAIEPEKALEAFKNVERAMFHHEYKNDLGGLKGYRGTLRNPDQMRYRNTLYLYGGNHLERMKRLDEAFLWYTKDIYFLDLPEMFDFYLTSLKTIERLLCAYHITSGKTETVLFKDLIDHCIIATFHNAAKYAREVLDYIAVNPGTDLNAERISQDPSGKYLLYAGEASRELFLIAILYARIVFQMDCQYIDYARFFIFD